MRSGLRLGFLFLTAAICCGASGTCSFSGGGFNFFVQAPLYETDAVISITQTAAGAQAEVLATITQGLSDAVELEEGQSIAINGEALNGPDGDGEYDATVPAATSYTVTVTEPRRGIEDTVINRPADFNISSPAAGGTASLSGFTLTWSNADAGLQVEVRLEQRILGRDREASLGPLTDAGSLALSAADLAEFQQGANLTISVTKINEVGAINGFAAGTLQSRLTQSVSVNPGP